jgi:hypothetical protein
MNAPRSVSAAEASAGHNKPAILTADMMARDFAYLEESLGEIAAKVKDCPPVVEDDDDLEIVREAVKRCQGASKRLETLRVESKEPYLAATRIVDGHFGKLQELVGSWKAAIEARAHRYLKKKEVAEKARREQEAREAAVRFAKAEDRRRQAEAERQKAEQELITSQQATQRISVEQHQRQENARLQEARLRAEAIQAEAEAFKTQKEAEAKPADLARTRSADGISTLTSVWKFEVTDPHAIKLDDPVLRSFIPWNVVEAALNRYAKTHKGERPLEGVRFYLDTEIRMT